MVSVRRVRQYIWASGCPPSGPTSVPPPPGHSPAHIPQHGPGQGPEEAPGPNRPGLGRAHATVHLLRPDPDVDRIGVVGLRGADIPGRPDGPGDGDAGSDLPQLVQAGRLHRLRLQHAPIRPEHVPETLRIPPLTGPVRPGRQPDRHRVRAEPGDRPGVRLEDAGPFSGSES